MPVRYRILIQLLLSLLGSHLWAQVYPDLASDNRPIVSASSGVKRISLNFQKIQLRAVLQLLADFSGVNIVVSDNVAGEVTLRLHNVPWEQALDIIIQTHGLRKRKSKNTLIIDKPDSPSATDRPLADMERNPGTTQPMRSELLPIKYAKAKEVLSLINDKQSTLLSPLGSVSADQRTNSLWVQDNKQAIRGIKSLVRSIDIPAKQVQIEARIVEVNKDFSQDLGIHWGASRLGSEPGLASKPLEGAASSPINKRLNLDLAASPVNLLEPASLGLALAKLGDGLLLDLELSALESEGRAELISSPRLMTTNQQTAVIESGQEIPYQETTRSGATAVAFKKAVLSLKVTPQINPDGSILMDLQINQDTPSHLTYNGVPAISTKEIQTKVLVNDGQTLVLGGIYRQDKNKTINRLPFFGQLPIIGTLFRNKQQSLVHQELLIFITPRVC